MTDQQPGELEQRFGSAKHPEREVEHPRPEGASDDLVEALGKLGAALETMEHARGFLYAFHRLSGTTDLELQGAVSALRKAGQVELADDVERTLVGRDVVAGRWTFQIVEDYDANYCRVFRSVEEHVRTTLGFSAPHTFEAEMKHAEQSAD